VAGRLIVFEGIEGAGKTTQLERLAARLEAAGVAVLALREPGGTPLGDEIRRLLLDPASSITPWSELFLFQASRAQIVAEVIRPALDRGKVVLLDRFILSTFAYQAGGRGLSETAVRSAIRAAVHGLVPDLTFLLRFSAKAGIARAKQRSTWDRIERAGMDFHAAVAAKFAEIASPAWLRRHPEAGPVSAVDATGTPEQVERRIVKALAARLPELGRKVSKVA
jgi:dTMP kinase